MRNDSEVHSPFFVSQQYRLMVFFIGLTRYSITVSKYSGQASTSSNKVAPRRWLEHTCDKGKIRELNKALSDENKKKEAKIIDIQRFQQTFEVRLSLKKKMSFHICCLFG